MTIEELTGICHVLQKCHGVSVVTAAKLFKYAKLGIEAEHEDLRRIEQLCDDVMGENCEKLTPFIEYGQHREQSTKVEP